MSSAIPQTDEVPGPDPFTFLVDDDSDDDVTPAASPLPPPSPNVQPSTPMNLSKAVPPTPESDEDEEDAPEIYLPSLVMPTMFLPIPQSDPLSTLVNKYLPPIDRPDRDVTGEWQRTEFHTMVMINSWRALAKMARDRLVSTDPEDLGLVLSLWYLRLSSLARLRLFNQTSAECTNLFSVLKAVEPASTRAWIYERVLPFELEVMHARLHYWSGDHMRYLDALNVLLRKCKSCARKLPRTETTDIAMWKERGSRLCLILASQLMEMKDYSAAAKLLEPLCKEPGKGSSALRSAVARIYIQGGYLAMAAKHLSLVDEDNSYEQPAKDTNTALLALARGDYVKAEDLLKKALDTDESNHVAVNNLAVALLNQGKLKEGIDILEKSLESSPRSVVVAEPFLFNLSTLYELRSATSAEKKRALLAQVAQYSGDGLKTACLKLSSS